MKKGVCSALLLGLLVLYLSPAPALAHRRGSFHRHHAHHFRGGYGPRFSFHVGIGVPVLPYYYGRPYVYAAPTYYPPTVVYTAPPVLYTAPPVVYTAPSVVQTPPPAAAATLQILVTPLQADIYLDGRYIGRAQEFPDGRVQLSVSPGSHTIELRLGTTAHTHTVSVGAGATVVISDRLS